MKRSNTSYFFTIALGTALLVPAVAQTDGSFRNGNGALNVRGESRTSAFASFSLASEEPGTSSSIRSVYSASASTNAPLFANKALYYVVPRLPSRNASTNGDGGEGIIDFALYGIKTESSLLGLMSANFMQSVNRSMPAQEDLLSKYYSESQEHGRNYYMIYGGNLDPTTGIMRVAGKNGRVSMLIPSSMLAGMAQPGSAYSTQMMGDGADSERGTSGRNYTHSEGEANADFGSLALNGDSSDLNAFDLALADLESVAAVAVSAPAGSKIVINVSDGKKAPVSVAFALDDNIFHHDFIAPISGSLSSYSGSKGDGFGNSQLTSLPSMNPAAAGYGGSNNGFNGGGAGGGFVSGVSYVPEGKSMTLFVFGLLALAPLARRKFIT